MYELNDNVTYFDSFLVKHSKRNQEIFDKSTVVTNILRIQAYYSIKCGYICIGFIMLKGKSLNDFNNLFSPKNVDIILNYFINKY